MRKTEKAPITPTQTLAVIPCWIQEYGKCVKGFEGRFLTKVGHCIKCEVFADEARKQGLQVQELIVQELEKYDQYIVSELQSTNQKLKANIDELSVLLDISTAMQATSDLDETLYIILSGLTAGFALGFNRALLFLVDESRKELVGKLGVGPSSGEEANTIWSQMIKHPITLHRMATSEAVAASKNSFMTQLAQKIHIPLVPNGGILAKAVLERKAFLIQDAFNDERVNKEIRDLLQTKTFATVPLLSKDKVIGALHVDNMYTNAPITEEDIQSLSRFANLAGLAIAESQAYERIEHFTEKLEAEITRTKNELQATEKELAHQEKLAALGQMAAGVAHELRNPMTAIRGFAQRIHRKMPKEDPSKKYASIIIEEMDRINQLIKDILDFSRKPDSSFERNNIESLLEEILFLFKEDFTKFPIEIRREYSKLPEFYFDETQIKQVLTNIIGNAIDVLEDGGVLTLRTRMDEKWMYVDIQDTGAGIWPEMLKDIFNPFFTTKPNGTGLGLATAHRFMEMHGGDILVESHVGQGSTFTVKLPYRMQGEQANSP